MEPAATAATAGERACCRLVGALENESSFNSKVHGRVRCEGN